MKLSKSILMVVSLLLACLAVSRIGFLPTVNGAASGELAGIEKLHQQDVAATLAGDPKALASLWTDDAVRLEPGPAEIGRALINTHDEEQKAKDPEVKII